MKNGIVTVACVLLLLAACSEQPQELAGGKVRPGAPDWQGPATPFTASGWKVGDEKSFDEHMKVRAQGQNEFVRIGAGG
jgi:hypothetical protein